jgi:hypothetical protein
VLRFAVPVLTRERPLEARFPVRSALYQNVRSPWPRRRSRRGSARAARSDLHQYTASGAACREGNRVRVDLHLPAVRIEAALELAVGFEVDDHHVATGFIGKIHDAFNQDT